MSANILLCYFGLLCFAIIDNGRGAAYPDILQSFNLTGQMGSWFFTISSISGLSANLCARFWLTKISPMQALRLAFISESLGSLLIASSGNFALPWWLTLLGSCLFGLGAGAANVAITIITTDSSQQENKRKIMAGLHSVYALTSLIAPLIMGQFLKSSHWWNYFYLTAVFPLLSLLLNFKSKRFQVSEKLKELHCPLNLKIIFGPMLALNVLAEVCVSSRLVFYLVEYDGISSIKGGQYLSLFFFFLFIGRLIGPLIPKNFPTSKVLLFSILGTLMCNSVALLFDIYYMFSIAAFFVALIFPFSLSWASDLFPKEGRALMTSMLNFVGATLIAMHIIFGSLTDIYSVKVAMSLPVTAGLLSLIFYMLAYRKEKLILQ